MPLAKIMGRKAAIKCLCGGRNVLACRCDPVYACTKCEDVVGSETLITKHIIKEHQLPIGAQMRAHADKYYTPLGSAGTSHFLCECGHLCPDGNIIMPHFLDRHAVISDTDAWEPCHHDKKTVLPGSGPAYIMLQAESIGAHGIATAITGYFCRLCNAIVTNGTEPEEHLSTKHPYEPHTPHKYTCRLCKKEFGVRGSFIMHVFEAEHATVVACPYGSVYGALRKLEAPLPFTPTFPLRAKFVNPCSSGLAGCGNRYNDQPLCLNY